MRTSLLLISLFFTILHSAQESNLVQFENHKGKICEVHFPTHGEIKLKNGDKIEGLFMDISTTTIFIRPVSNDAASLQEAKKNTTLSDLERVELLYTQEIELQKSNVKHALLRKPKSTEKTIGQVGLGVMAGLTVAAATFGTIQDIENNRTPQLALAAVVVLPAIVWMLHRTSTIKLNFYKWKVKPSFGNQK